MNYNVIADSLKKSFLIRKKKHLLLTAVASIGLTTATMAQQTLLGFNLACVNNTNPPGNTATAVNVSLPVSQWSYIALTKSSTNQCNLYLNGQNIFIGNYANITYTWIKLILGAQLQLNYSNYFDGSIDEVRVSNSVRSAADISNYFSTNSPFVIDANTIGLWHFDQSSGTTVTGAIGGNGTTNASWASGKFGNSLLYNGISNHTDFNFTTPTTNSTIEFWIKPNTFSQSWPVMTHGGNSAGLLLQTYTTSVTGISEQNNFDKIKIFPNPAQNIITIKATTKLDGSVYSIYDNIGRVVASGKLNGEITKVELGHLAAGIYTLRVGDNLKQTFKIVKE